MDKLPFVCPRCRAPLPASSAALECPECRAKYPIVNGVPRFVDLGGGHAAPFGFQWNTHRKTQLDSFTGRPISEERLFLETGWPRQMEGQRILEAGSGAGRFTEVLCRTGADIYSFDMTRAVEANSANNGGCEGLALFQADIFSIPLPERSFDRVFCLGVLQHTPDPARAFASLAKYIRPGGEIVVDAYAGNLTGRLQWKYVLRPITSRMPAQTLYRIVEKVVPALSAPTAFLHRFGLARLSPILDYSHLGFSAGLNRSWSILNSFDMYAPAYDYPQTTKSMRKWFEDAGLGVISLRYMRVGGVVGRGKYPN